MPRSRLVVLFLALLGGWQAAVLPVTPNTVVAKVTSFEHYRSVGDAWRFSSDSPYGNLDTVVAVILHPASLAGREIAIPFESRKDQRELFVQPGTVFRFEHRLNVADLRDKTDNVRRRAIGFPPMGIIVLKPDGEVGEAYEGSLTPLMAAAWRKRAVPGGAEGTAAQPASGKR